MVFATAFDLLGAVSDQLLVRVKLVLEQFLGRFGSVLVSFESVLDQFWTTSVSILNNFWISLRIHVVLSYICISFTSENDIEVEIKYFV